MPAVREVVRIAAIGDLPLKLAGLVKPGTPVVVAE